MKTLVIILIVLGFAVTGAFIVMGYLSRGGQVPGLVNGSLSPCGPNPNCVSSLVPVDSPHYIKPFEFEAGQADSEWRNLTTVVTTLGGHLEHNAPPYLAATFTSRIFRFVDDFECVIDQAAGLIQVRAGARVGYSDLDVNRKRVEQIRNMLRAGS